MTIKEFILGTQVYAVGGEDDLVNDEEDSQQQTNAEEQCRSTYGTYFTETVVNGNTDICKCTLGNETFNCTELNAKLSADCTENYGHLFVAQDANGACLCEKTAGKDPVECSTLPQDKLNELCGFTSPRNPDGTRLKRDSASSSCICKNGEAKNADGTPKKPAECIKTPETLGIKCTAEQLINNTCSRNINKTLGIRQSDPTPSPTLLLQDVVLGATSFVGTVMMIALVYLGFTAILKGADDSDAMTDIKGKAKNLIIGLLLVIASYSIIRIIQYVARGV